MLNRKNNAVTNMPIIKDDGNIDICFDGYGIKILLCNAGNPNPSAIWKLIVFSNGEDVTLSIPGKKDKDNFTKWLTEKALDCIFTELNNWYWNFNENAQKIKKILLPINYLITQQSIYPAENAIRFDRYNKPQTDEINFGMNPVSYSDIAAKPFIASPIYSDQVLSIQRLANKNINLTHGHLKIIFENNPGDDNWRLEVTNNDKPMPSQYSMIFSSKESINKIQKFLQEDNIAEFIEFLEKK